jgi:hypothetical protein
MSQWGMGQWVNAQLPHRVRYPGFCPGLPWVLSRVLLQYRNAASAGPPVRVAMGMNAERSKSGFPAEAVLKQDPGILAGPALRPGYWFPTRCAGQSHTCWTQMPWPGQGDQCGSTGPAAWRTDFCFLRTKDEGSRLQCRDAHWHCAPAQVSLRSASGYLPPSSPQDLRRLRSGFSRAG